MAKTQVQVKKIDNALPDVPAEVMEKLEAGSTLVRLENDVQMGIALKKPRDERKILEGAMTELDIYPNCAAEALYNKPVGKDDTGIMKYAEGLSIRAAESLGNRWGNNAFGCQTISENDTATMIAAVFLDYERNNRRVIEKRVSKFYKTREGQVRAYTPDRYDIVLAANQSKALREAILRSLPAGLKEAYMTKAKSVLSKGKVEDRRKRMIAAFKVFKVTTEMIAELGGKAVVELTHDDLDELQGAYNALKDGEVTLQELFPNRQFEQAKPNGNSKLKVAAASSPEVQTEPMEVSLWRCTHGCPNFQIPEKIDNCNCCPECGRSDIEPVIE